MIHKKDDTILMISYFSSTKGCSPAELVDDKIYALDKLDKKVILVSSMFSKEHISKNILHFRVPSLSLQDIKHEISEMKTSNMKVPFFYYFSFRLSFLLLDYLQIIYKSFF